MILDQVSTRESRANDTAFIASTWLRYFKFSSPFGRKIKPSVYFDHHPDIVNAILKRQTTKVYVCCDKEYPDVILGYLVTEVLPTVNVIHFLYTKENFRRFGIAKKLISDSGINPDQCVFTHWVDDTFSLIGKYPNIIHNPYLV